MALRIAGPKKPMPMEEEMPMEQPEAMMEEMPEEMPEEMTAEAPTEEMGEGGGAVPQEIVHYMGPERMEISCSNCDYFSGQGTCVIVAGQIDPEGICNLHSSVGQMELSEEAPLLEEEAVGEEPAPEPMLEEEPGM